MHHRWCSIGGHGFSSRIAEQLPLAAAARAAGHVSLGTVPASLQQSLLLASLLNDVVSKSHPSGLKQASWVCLHTASTSVILHFQPAVWADLMLAGVVVAPQGQQGQGPIQGVSAEGGQIRQVAFESQLGTRKVGDGPGGEGEDLSMVSPVSLNLVLCQRRDSRSVHCGLPCRLQKARTSWQLEGDSRPSRARVLLSSWVKLRQAAWLGKALACISQSDSTATGATSCTCCLPERGAPMRSIVQLLSTHAAWCHCHLTPSVSQLHNLLSSTSMSEQHAQLLAAGAGRIRAGHAHWHRLQASP